MDHTTVHNASASPRPLKVGDLAPGHLIANRYRVGEELGRGAMGVVYQALDTETQKSVVLKLVRHGEDQRLLAERFERGTRILLNLDHPSICRAEGCGRAQDYHYVVMRDLPGVSVLDALNARLRFSGTVAARLVASLCDGLAYLHAQNVVHRDVKPGNLILTGPRGAETLVLIDFDLAKHFAPNLADSGRFNRNMVLNRLSTAGCLSGTPIYMSPERLRGEAGGPDADVYAAGLVLYQMICGDLPTSGEAHRSVAALLQARAIPVPPPSEWGVSLTPALERVLLKALSPNRAERYASAVGMARDLRQAIRLRAPTPIPFRMDLSSEQVG
jgi:eukaryotic-like serine/threonine-protein kinase